MLALVSSRHCVDQIRCQLVRQLRQSDQGATKLMTHTASLPELLKLHQSLSQQKQVVAGPSWIFTTARESSSGWPAVVRPLLNWQHGSKAQHQTVSQANNKTDRG